MMLKIPVVYFFIDHPILRSETILVMNTSDSCCLEMDEFEEDALLSASISFTHIENKKVIVLK